MKKILLSAIVLTLFAVSMLLFQISCKKEAKAQNLATTITSENKILYLKAGQTSGTSAIYEANYDGTGAQQVLIDLPPNLAIESLEALSPDHTTIFFTVFNPNSAAVADLYSCKFDGSGVKKIVTDGWNVIAF